MNGLSLTGLARPVQAFGAHATLEDASGELAAGRSAVVRDRDHWSFLAPGTAAGYPPTRRLIDLPLREARLVDARHTIEDVLEPSLGALFEDHLLLADKTLLGVLPSGRLRTISDLVWLERHVGTALLGSILLDAELRVLHVSPGGWALLLGFDQQPEAVATAPLDRIGAQSTRALLEPAARAGVEIELNGRRLRCRARPTSTCDLVLLFGEDPERQAQQAQLAQVGRLAAGIGHDINNLLTAVLGQAELLRRSPDNVDVAAQAIRDAALRAAELSVGLTRLAMPPAPQAPGTASLNELLSSMQVLLRPSLPHCVALALDLSADLPLVRADAPSIERMVLNLVVNAMDALAQTGRGGRIDLITARDDTSRAVLLKVRDDGVGMDAVLRRRVFEPFFSTKTDGGGSGLGLAIVQRIVNELDGGISLESEPGRGTTVTLRLPTTA